MPIVKEIHMDLIGCRIKHIRKNLNINQVEFAKSIGVSQGTLSDIENNKFSPSVKTIECIMKEFDICSNWILVGDCKYSNYNKNCPYFNNLKNLNIVSNG